MIRTRSKDFGKKSRNNTNKFLLCVFVFGVLCGLIFGILVNDVPFFTFNSNIDVASIISMLSLVVTIFLMPFIIDRAKDNKSKIKMTATADLDYLCSNVDRLKELYMELSDLGISRLSYKNYVKIITIFKSISSLSGKLNEEFKNRNVGYDYNDINNIINEAHSKCTGFLKIRAKLDPEDIQGALVILINLYNSIRQFKYRIYENRLVI